MSESENGSVTALGDVDPGQIVDKAALLSGAAFGLTDVPIPGFGVVKVKPLSRAQALGIYNQQMDAATMEQTVISLAAVQPTFTKGEVARWQEIDTAGGSLFTLVNTILDLSGMDMGAGKSAYKTFRGSA